MKKVHIEEIREKSNSNPLVVEMAHGSLGPFGIHRKAVCILVTLKPKKRRVIMPTA